MGIANLTGPRAKLRRAEEHLDIFDSEFRTFALREPDSIFIEFRCEEGWYVAYAHPFPQLPVRIALIAGDCINNLRAVLDHLVWQLVLREDREPGYTHHFPFCESRQKFLNEVKSPPRKKLHRNPLRGIPIDGDAWTIIEKAQPFHRSEPQDDALFLLAQLTNIDKHRTLLIQRSFPDRDAIMKCIRWNTNSQPIKREFSLSMPSPEYPTQIARFLFPPHTDPGMHVEGKFRVFPTFGDGQTQVSFDVLRAIQGRTREILNQVAALPRVQG